ncbi:Calcium uniporter protein 2, mitochondrial [Zea mays]|uniref:Calcium uniporter protein 4 mitochondrial n=2 Tax=Zea mays TaxID=4577 RepID=K7W1M1_MAIZE|nr:calcium uniporter protein 2, mitochondrial [Zea mays]AQL08318.1 Calcium uniporter protein 4 mitochondrial [Zea mays]PWZ05281.1 Calcium uniporter protein 2, mitochondrial [Zea mays]|eukprot:XP_008660379.1 calcium uniporter protein 2, mitochondrial [Zea mays]
MAFHRTMARCLWAGKNAAASGAAIPKPPSPHLPARRSLPAVDDCQTLAFLRPRPTAVGYATATVPLPAHCFPALPVGDHLFRRLQLDGLIPPVSTVARPPEDVGVTVEQARKVARAAEMEVARARLRSNAQSVVSGSEFAALCVDIAGGVEGGRRLARALDESGGVIVLGDVVFLCPDMVAKAIGSILPGKQQQLQAPRAGDGSEARKRELEAMEAQRAAIDAAAAAQVRRELWCGLGLLATQTLGFMRLTFWELSWDVMEPVCFYVTSLYFMSGYFFFMRTATEPSFEGFFRSRFASRQRRLMRARGFDVDRYNALRKGQGLGPLGDPDACRHVSHAQ